MLLRALLVPLSELIVATPEDTLEDALDKINSENFLSIPVVDEKRFIGVISKERIFSTYFELGGDREDFLRNNRVLDLVRTDIPILSVYDDIERAAHTLEPYGIPFVAVTDENGEFAGIITHHTIFKTFVEVFGMNKGHKISVIAYDIPGQIEKLTDIITKMGGNIISLVVLDPKVKTDVKEIVIRIDTDRFVETVDAIRDAGFRVQ